MNHASLFSGIGGFDLAAQWMGWENVMQCEINPFCQKVLKHHFPTAKLYEDIRTINGKEWEGKIDILTGGFPCQPFSAAGRRKGVSDDRYLWPEMLRVVQEIKPTWIVAENVRGIVSIGGGLVFEQVCADLEANEYEVQPFCIPACAVNAPHRRERIWFIAHHRSEREQRRWGKKIQRKPRVQRGEDERGLTTLRDRSYLHAPKLCRSRNGISQRLDACGNAIVPQVAYEIFKAIPI